jgi:hypothetical protein
MPRSAITMVTEAVTFAHRSSTSINSSERKINVIGSIRRRVAVIVLAGLAALVLAATPAVASTAGISSSAAAALPLSNKADCNAYAVDMCWWVNANQVGKMHPVRDAISDWRSQTESTCPGGTWNDCASTLYNPSSTRKGAVVYVDIGYQSWSYCAVPGAYLADLNDFTWPGSGGAKMNDSISSNSWIPGGC